MTSNEKQSTVTRKMLTAVARDQRWPDVVAGISAVFPNLLLFCFAINYKKSLNDWSLGNGEFCFPRISMFPSTSSRETLRFSGNKIHCSPRDQSLSINNFFQAVVMEIKEKKPSCDLFSLIYTYMSLFYPHRIYERKSKDNEVLFKHLQFFPELADKVPGYVLKELCAVAQIDKCPEEDYAGLLPLCLCESLSNDFTDHSNWRP